MGYLDETFRDYRQRLFAVFDVECLERDADQVNIDCYQRIVSIATATNIPGENKRFFCLKNSEEDSYDELYEEFFDYLQDLADLLAFHLPDEFEEALCKLEEDLAVMPFSPEKSELMKLKRGLESFSSLSVFTFNGGRYDLKIVAGDLYKYCTKKLEQDINLKPTPLKRGTSYISLRYGNVVMKDILKFTAPTKLDNYLKQWQSTFGKMIFPYSAFRTIEDIEKQIDFPSREQFYNKLYNVS